MGGSRVVQIVVLLAVVGAVLAQDLPQIVKTILPEIKRMGLTGYLNCTITRQGNNKQYWIHKQSKTVITSDDKVDLEDDLNEKFNGWPKFDVEKHTSKDRDMVTYMLIIRQLQASDSGSYTCQVVVKGGDQQNAEQLVTIQKDGLLTVLVPPTIIPSETTQTVIAQETDHTTLTCGASGYPKPNITWVRANGQMLPKPYSRIAYRGTKLELENIRGEDRGVYRCVADNAVRPPATYDTTLYIAFKPYARPVQSSYGQAQNRLFDLTIECIVSGYPQPDLKWYQVIEGSDSNPKGGLKPINDDDRHVVHVFESHGQTLSMAEYWLQLTVINVLANDYGYYECQGSNKLGASGARVRVYETSECQGPNCPPGDKVGSPTKSPASIPRCEMFSIVLLSACAVLLAALL